MSMLNIKVRQIRIRKSAYYLLPDFTALISSDNVVFQFFQQKKKDKSEFFNGVQALTMEVF